MRYAMIVQTECRGIYYYAEVQPVKAEVYPRQVIKRTNLGRTVYYRPSAQVCPMISIFIREEHHLRLKVKICFLSLSVSCHAKISSVDDSLATSQLSVK